MALPSASVYSGRVAFCPSFTCCVPYTYPPSDENVTVYVLSSGRVVWPSPAPSVPPVPLCPPGLQAERVNAEQSATAALSAPNAILPNLFFVVVIYISF